MEKSVSIFRRRPLAEICLVFPYTAAQFSVEATFKAEFNMKSAHRDETHDEDSHDRQRVKYLPRWPEGSHRPKYTWFSHIPRSSFRQGDLQG